MYLGKRGDFVVLTVLVLLILVSGVFIAKDGFTGATIVGDNQSFSFGIMPTEEITENNLEEIASPYQTETTTPNSTSDIITDDSQNSDENNPDNNELIDDIVLGHQSEQGYSLETKSLSKGMNYSDANWSMVAETDSYFWLSYGILENIGDINNDTFEDFIVFGTDDLTGDNLYHLKYGEDYSHGTNITANQSEAMFRLDVSSFVNVAKLGDINGDGYGDFSIVKNNERLMIFFGGIGTPYLGDLNESFANVSIFATNTYFTSTLVEGNCDFNNDGKIDFLVSTPTKYGVNGNGQIDLYFGRENYYENFTANVSFLGFSLNEYAGNGIACSDLNDDGFDEVIIASRNAGIPSNGDGAVFVFYGATTNEMLAWGDSYRLSTSNANITLIESDYNGNQFGSILEVADLNNDSYKEMIIGESGQDRIFIVDFSQNIGSQYDVLNSYSMGGGSITTYPSDLEVGDFNNDDYDDFVISGSNSSNDILLVFYGEDNFNWQNGTVSANATFINSGQSLADTLTKGDFNGDDVDDILVGSPDWEDYNGDGRLDMFFGFGGVNITSTPANSPPWVVNLSLQSVMGFNRTDELLHSSYDSGDDDNESYTRIINWYKNGVSFNVLNAAFEYLSNSTFTKDHSSYGNNGTVVGAVYSNSSGGDGFGAYTFDGGDYIQFPNSSVYSTGIDNGFTVVSKVNLTSSKDHAIVSFPGTDNNSSFHFGITSLEQPIIRLSNGTNYTEKISSLCSVTLNDWNFVAVSYDPGGEVPVALHINDCVESFSTDFEMKSVLNGPVIGAKLGYNSWYLNGTVDDLKIFDTALSVNQINKIKQGDKHKISGQETSLNDVWQMELILYDKIDESSVYLTNNLTITNYNTLPTTENVTILTPSGLNTTTENITLVFDINSDAENDSTKGIINWYKNNNSFTVLNLPFEGGSNSTWTNDYSGYGYNGSVNGATWDSESGYDDFGAYDFDGVDDYINLSDAGNFNFTNEITVATWVNQTSLPTNWVKYVVRGRDSCGPPYVNVYLGTWNAPSENKPRWALDINGNSIESNESISFEMNENEWYLIVGTYDGNYLRLYANGEEIDNQSYSGTISNVNNPFGIGQELTGCTGSYFNGTIDEVMIFNHSLSAEQIFALYQNRTDLIVSQETTVNDTWEVQVTPTDAYGFGNSYLSNSINITEYNNPPNLTGANILPSMLYTNNDSQGLVVYTDLENDVGSVNFTWYVNHIEVFSEIISNVNSSDTVFSILGSENYSKTDLVNFTAYANDGYSDSSSVYNAKNVVNHLPSQTTPILNSSRPWNNNTLQDLIVYNQSTYDADNDLVKNIYVWKKNFSSITLVNTPFDGELLTSYGIDLSGNNHHLWTCGYDLNNDCDIDQGPNWNQTGGYDGFGAFEFDGINDYLDLDNATNQSSVFDLEVTERTYEFRYKANDIVNEQLLLDQGDNVVGLNIYLNDSKIFAGAWSAFYSWTGDWINTTTTADEWHHVVFVYDSVTLRGIKLYHDGVLIGQSTVPGSLVETYGDDALGSISGASRFPSGAETSQFGMFFNGTIDEFRVYNSSISSNQVNLLYSNQTDQIDSLETNPGEFWFVNVIPTDGSIYSTLKESNNITIQDLECGKIDYPFLMYENIEYDGNESCFIVTGENIELDLGGYILNSTSGYGIGINVTERTGVNITNGYLRGFDKGIYIENSSDISITEIETNYNDLAINLVNTNNSMIYTNQIRTNGEGINLSNSYSNNITNNFFYNSGGNNDDGNNIWNLTYNCNISNWTNIVGGNCQGGNSWYSYSGADLGGGDEYPHNVSRDGVGDTLIPHNSSSQILNGGDYLPLKCIESWSCTLSECVGSIRYRTCTDENRCGTTIARPSLTVSCGGSGGSSYNPGSSIGQVPNNIYNPADLNQNPNFNQGQNSPLIDNTDRDGLINPNKLNFRKIQSNRNQENNLNDNGPDDFYAADPNNIVTGGSGGSSRSYYELTFDNEGESVVLVNPTVERQKLNLDNDSIVVENEDLIKEKISQLFGENDVDHMFQIIHEKELQNVKLMNHKPFSSFNINGLNPVFDFSKANVVSGEALIPRLKATDSDGNLIDVNNIVVNPGQSFDIFISVDPFIDITGASSSIQVKSDNDTVVEELDNVFKEEGVYFDPVNEDLNSLDIYVTLPQDYVDNNIVEEEEYYVEYNLDELKSGIDGVSSKFAITNLLFNNVRNLGLELRGPFSFKLGQHYILAENIAGLEEVCRSESCVLTVSFIDSYGNELLGGSFTFSSNLNSNDLVEISSSNVDPSALENNLLTGMAVNELDLEVESVSTSAKDYLRWLFVIVLVGLLIYFWKDIRKRIAKLIIKFNRKIRKNEKDTYYSKKVENVQNDLDNYLTKIRKIYNHKKNDKGKN